ncbi:Ubiquinone biosynthesis O-methyltransferase [Vibrio thalassae]|uniref:Ubiquinone biosynthesis O-methyltransferase n=1 Tax=Vibrio thalassae TaxID=1243014 RepID=A0A240EL42_9VIBR|nr:class I SAM-dependent methyltransferase [Vibrio thalassae]SNX49398.1 Ubiquinone biosynthesis O-methyltransferase [Vibrio thalassae]
MSITSSFYDQNADSLAEQYNSLTFEEVHASWKAYWPLDGDTVLDVGASSGRDAKWMAQQGAEIFALEPSPAMMSIGKANTGDVVTWLQDELPSLKTAQSLGIRFDLILVSAVWMHVPPSQRSRAFRKLSNLLAPNGRLVITLRHGPFDDERIGYPVSISELEQFAKDTALLVKEVSDSGDSLGRSRVTWQTVVLSLPDDGSGDLNKVRHIIVNDSKSATYKLALLRVLLRIADAHPGCVSDRTGGEVAIPMGLVALYWVKAFKRLIDIGKLQQNSNPNSGLGFVTEEGWHQLKHLSADDLAVGSLFLGDEAKALQKTIQASIKTMKEGPIAHISTGTKQDKKHEFSTVAPAKRRRTQHSVYLDTQFFESFGFFVLKQSLWECFRLYNSWIEPLVVNQWVMQMQRFELNRKNNVSLQSYHDCLVWLDKDHDTREVRKRVGELQREKHRVSSVWSNTKLTKSFHVDHCLPFAYWPNNDMWNLLPTTENENSSKSDRLPSKKRLVESRNRIVNWWHLAWGEQDQHRQRFFTEAALSLPNLPPRCRDFEEVFDAMGLQIRGVKSRLLINEW